MTEANEAEMTNTTDTTDTTDPGTSDTATAGATFHATRGELLGDRPLLDTAELARSYCATADRVVSVVAITTGRIRRVDCWLGGVGFVTHAAANDPALPLLGSVCDRDRAAEMTGSLVDSLVGGLAPMPADAAIDLERVGSIGPNALPDGIGWVVIVSANSTTGGSAPERLVVAGAETGLTLAPLPSLDESVRLDPVTADRLHDRLEQLIGPGPKSVSELLGED